MKKHDRKFVSTYTPRYKLIDEDTGKEISFETSFRKAKVGKLLYGFARRSASAQNYISKRAKDEVKRYINISKDKNRSAEEQKMAKENASKYELIDKISIRFTKAQEILRGHYANNPVLLKFLEKEADLSLQIKNIAEQGIEYSRLYNYLLPLMKGYLDVFFSETVTEQDYLDYFKVFVIFSSFSVSSGTDEKIKLTRVPEEATDLATKEIINNNPELRTPLHQLKAEEPDKYAEVNALNIIRKSYSMAEEYFPQYTNKYAHSGQAVERSLLPLIKGYYKNGTLNTHLFTNKISKGLDGLIKRLIVRKKADIEKDNAKITELIILLDLTDSSGFFDHIPNIIKNALESHRSYVDFPTKASKAIEELSKSIVDEIIKAKKLKFT